MVRGVPFVPIHTVFPQLSHRNLTDPGRPAQSLQKSPWRPFVRGGYSGGGSGRRAILGFSGFLEAGFAAAGNRVARGVDIPARRFDT
jgi:hypothetical protein